MNSATASFKRRIILLLALALAAMTLLAVGGGYKITHQLLEGRRAELVAAVDSAHSLVAAYAAKAKSGAMTEAQAKSAAIDALRNSRYGSNDYFYIWTVDSVNVLLPTKPEWEGKDMHGKVLDGRGNDIIAAMSAAVRASSHGAAFVDTQFPHPGETVPVDKLQYVKLVPEWNWMVGSGLYQDGVQAQMRSLILELVALVLALLVAIGGVGMWIVKSVLRQLGGEPTVAAAIVSDVAQGNLTTVIPAAPTGSLMADLAQMVAALRSTVQQVHETTGTVNHAASEIAAGNLDLSNRTEKAASSLVRTASAMEQLTAAVKQTADAARTANQLAVSATSVAQRGGDVVSEVVRTMESINASSAKMADIIGVIDGIAFQTNILALNAAVEAARAGEQGRGFAVVASEVRTLAQRSSAASKEIRSLIGASIDKVASGTQLVSTAGTTMGEIVDSVRRVTDIVEEISVAASEQSQGLQSMNSAVTEIDNLTQQNAALVEQSAAAAASLRDQAERLTTAVSVFRVNS